MNERVARMMGTTEIHRLGQLSDTECWLLMQRIAFSRRRKEECEKLYDIGKNIANKCKGLPLAAKVLGSLLHFKDTVEEWEDVLNSEIWQLEKAKVDLFPHLLLSYNELSSAMKRCFSYCAIFPKDSTIYENELIRMWMALGYLGSDGSPGVLELRGKEYFDNLKMRSLFQDFVTYGDEMSCKMHDIVHDFAQFLTERRSHDSANRDGRVEEREKRSHQALDPSLVSQIKINRGLFCPKKLSIDLLDSVTCLRVLSLSYCKLEEIPGTIANLIHLRYLDLSGNTLILQALQTICKLYNLQTLYLRYCKLKEIPREFENLIQLRHLDLTSNTLVLQVLQTICKLYNLQTLNLSSCELKEIPRELGNLIQLRHLDLSLNDSIEELPETIYNLHNLRSLDLSCCSLSSLPEGIHKLLNLRHLLNFSIDRIPQGLERLTGLQTLTEFVARSDGNKLGYLKKLDQLSGSLNLQIHLHGQGDVEEAKKAALRNKKHIICLRIQFLGSMCESDGEKLVENEVLEALQPPPNLQRLSIASKQGTKFPNWVTSSLSHLKVLEISNFCTTLPPLGKLPCLEELSVLGMREFKFLNKEFLGISGDVNGSTPSSATVIGFPKLKKLKFGMCHEWKEWEDIKAEEELNSALSLMPCLREMKIYCCELMTLPHRLLHKASAVEYLTIKDSLHLSERYEEKNGSGWRFLSHIPHVEMEYIKDRNDGSLVFEFYR